MGSPISVQTMEKQGFDYEIDALHRGGSLDEESELPVDEDDIEQAIKEKELENVKNFSKMLQKGEITFGKIN